jgi:hypothetical protein
MTGINQNARRCALYLRSSKDRTDVSIDAQRRELQILCKSRNLTIVEEFTDAVESGKDANRPGFQNLIRKINNKSRPWNVVLMVDTSRLARNQYVAHSFGHGTKDDLAAAVQYAACGMTASSFAWHEKPCGRIATSLVICWTEDKRPSAGHIDLSVMGPNVQIEARPAFGASLSNAGLGDDL